MSSNSGSSDASGEGDDLSSLTGFFFYVIIVHPITAWILRPGRFERKRAIMYAIGFLATLAALKTGGEMQQRGPNHYERLGVSRSSNPLEIKRAYKKLSLELHPDKNPSEDAAAQFQQLKGSYDVLMDMELREVYNKFGPEGVNGNKRFDETTFFIELGVFYVSWATMVFILTLGKKSGEARQWILTGLIVMLVAEIAVMTSQTNPLPVSVFPRTTEAEVVWFLHSIFPAFMNGCRSLGAYLYVDRDAHARKLLLALQEQNADILLVLRDVQIGVQTLQSTMPSSSSSITHANASTANARVAQHDASSRFAGATPTGKLKELQERLQASNATVAQAVTQIKTDETAASSNTGFYLMIIGYFVFSYIFG